MEFGYQYDLHLVIRMTDDVDSDTESPVKPPKYLHYLIYHDYISYKYKYEILIIINSNARSI